jgi:hypothetical protein
MTKAGRRQTWLNQVVEKAIYFVIPGEARNLSFSSMKQIEERFLASPGITKVRVFRKPPGRSVSGVGRMDKEAGLIL